jgi:hypothetical protein
MTETVIVLKVTHKKDLPKDATDAVASRFYTWAYSRGTEVTVTATIAELPKLPGKEGEE